MWGEWGSEVGSAGSGDQRSIVGGVGIIGLLWGEWGSEVGSAGNGDQRSGVRGVGIRGQECGDERLGKWG